jgi:hypothetical protein
MKKVVGGVSLLQLVLTWPSWAYHVVKPYWIQALPCSSLVRLLWLKTTGVSLTLTKCAPWVLVIIDPCPCGFARAFKMLIRHPFCRVVDIKVDPTLKLTSVHKFDSIWVVIDRLTKSAHFIPVHTKYRVQKYAEIYIAHMLCLHGVSKMTISDRGSRFVAHFWEQLHTSLETHLIHSLAYHPQSNG